MHDKQKIFAKELTTHLISCQVEGLSFWWYFAHEEGPSLNVVFTNNNWKSCILQL